MVRQRLFDLKRSKIIAALYSVWDILDDTVERDEKGSDATECAAIMGCPGASRVVGVCWMAIAFTLFLVAVIIHLLILQPLHEGEE